MHEGETVLPAAILICCEGKETEPQYFNLVIRQRRITAGQAKVKVVGGKGQHKVLIDKANVERERLAISEDLDPDEIEVWAVCDKDEMSCTIAELEKYAEAANVKLAFSDPKFEIYLLQHLVASSTTESGKQLDSILTKQLGKRLKGAIYDKTDLRNFGLLFDQEPSLIENAIKNSKQLEDKENYPYTTTHRLLERLLELAP